VAQFHRTAENAYAGDPAAIAAGKQIYARLCQACHLPDGAGRIGPSLVDGEGARARTATDRGRFEIIYAGGAGAMQAFGQRLDQDEILQVMAYLEVLREAK
jgi:cytochrome c-L